MFIIWYRIRKEALKMCVAIFRHLTQFNLVAWAWAKWHLSVDVFLQATLLATTEIRFNILRK